MNCMCEQESAWYSDMGTIKCQYCMGEITDKKRLNAIKEYNTEVKK